MTTQPTPPIKLTDEMRELLGSALANRTPCFLATASTSGQPSIGPKGSMMVFDDDYLAYWERVRRGLLENIRENPQVAVLYFDIPRRKFWRFYGRATVHESGPARDEIMARTVKVEIDRDPQRKGYGVLIRVDRVTDLQGNVLQQRA